MLAEETLIPRPKVDPSKAAVLNDEEAEAEAETNAANSDAYVVKEAGNTGVREVFEGQQNNVRRTAKIYEKPAAAVATPAPAQTIAPAGASRPRRVGAEGQPQRQQ
jgi:hypothetical protein